jgi:quercetin dioxygenase-like cupin family protein
VRKEGKEMNSTCKILLFLLFVLGITSVPTGTSTNSQVAKETPLMTKELPDVPGKEGLIERVALSPGEVVPRHRHNADVFAYVLEGSVITQLKGGNPQTVHAGEVFYESPTDVHVETRNASMTQPATLLVFFVKKTGAPPTVAVGEANAPR